MKRIVMLLFLVPLFVVTVSAEEYELRVERSGSNLFYLASENLYIQTEYCFSAQGALDVLLLVDGHAGEMKFITDGSTCRVIGYYGKATLDAGTYPLRISRDDDDWYRIIDKDSALKTSGCLTQVEDVAATMILTEEGSGTLIIPATDEQCAITSVFTRVKLE